MDRQTGRQKNRQLDRQTYRQADKQMDIQTDRLIEGREKKLFVY